MPTIALFAWPVLTVIFFSAYRVRVALLLCIIGGYLLLPPSYGINLPLLPTFEKNNVAGLAALACALLFVDPKNVQQPMQGWIPKGFIVRALLFCMLGGFVATTLMNSDVQIFGGRIARAMSIYDGFSGLLSSLMLLIPFLLGRRYFATPEAQKTMVVALALAGFAYSFLALFEVRMSPQLNRWIYGYFPHSWTQHTRGGGFRPVVFLSHGLWLSIFFTMTYLAALGCTRVFVGKWRAATFALAGWLLLTLFLTKSLGAFMIALILTPVVLFLSKRTQFIFVGITALVVLLYPMLRVAGVIPVDRVTEFVQGIDQKRANSFEFRVYNEDVLLEHAMKRPLFGWGGNGRWLVNDPSNRYGDKIVVPDGYWTILFGRAGWIGYLGEFGLLIGPIFLLALRGRKTDFGPETAVLAITLTANMIDLIPNASMVPITWLLAGAIWGRLELGTVSDTAGEDTKTPAERTTAYRRGQAAGSSKGRKPPPKRTDRAEPAYSRFSTSTKN